MKLSLMVFLVIINSASAAVYSVPVEENLKQYSSFHLKGFRLNRYNGETEVKYKLPLELTGVEQKVEFSGIVDLSSKTNILHGENGTLICDKDSNGEISCQVEYKNLIINEEKAISNIVQSSTNRSEMIGKIQVMRAFSSDPVGIITYK